MLLSFVVPTRNRPACLHRTLRRLTELATEASLRRDDAEIIVVDNASRPPARVDAPPSGAPEVRLLRRARNEMAAARNVAARRAAGDWLVMLDDDSRPVDGGLLDALAAAGGDVAAVGAEILLPGGAHEAGGLPEVFVGCGAALRRRPFLEAGGYDPRFGYYAEEYDLAARLIASGWRIIHDRRFRVLHEKAPAGRDINAMLARLVRNNGWVAQRYAPEHRRLTELHEAVRRYARIALAESAEAGFARGLAELRRTLDAQPRTPLTDPAFDRFTGLAAVRQTLAEEPALRGGASAAIVGESKNAWVVGEVLRQRSVPVVGSPAEADVLVIGTLSPGPMLDALARWRGGGQPVIMPWRLGGRVRGAPVAGRGACGTRG